MQHAWEGNVYIILVIRSEEGDCLEHASVSGIIILKLISNGKDVEWSHVAQDDGSCQYANEHFTVL